MKKFIITEETLQRLFTYLADKPYKEARPLVDLIEQGTKVYVEPEPQEEKQ